MSISISITSGLLITIISSIVINRISFILTNTEFIYPKNIRKSNQSYYYWRYRNFFISFIHAFITGVCSFLCVLSNPMLLWDVIDTPSDFGYVVTAFSLGYFIYDTFEMASFTDKKGTTELLLHHFFVISCFLNTIIYQRYIGFNMLALIIEISNVFLHFRQLLLLSNYSKSTNLYRINSYINILLFLLVRGLCMLGLWYTLIINVNRIPLISQLTGIISMIGITITTIILFKRIWISDFSTNQNNNQNKKEFINNHNNKYNKSTITNNDDFTYEGST